MTVRSRAVLLVSIGALLFGAGCSSGNDSGPPLSGSNDASPGKYDQTWTESYGDTTCADWNSKMNDHQRWVAAADMLVNGRGTWDIDTLPSDALVDTFEADIDKSCQPEASLTLSDAATALLLIGGKSTYGA